MWHAWGGKDTWKALVEKHEAKRKSGKRQHNGGCNIVPGIQEISCCVVERIHLDQHVEK